MQYQMINISSSFARAVYITIPKEGLVDFTLFRGCSFETLVGVNNEITIASLEKDVNYTTRVKLSHDTTFIRVEESGELTIDGEKNRASKEKILITEEQNFKNYKQSPTLCLDFCNIL